MLCKDKKVSSQQGDWHFVELRDLEQEKKECPISNMEVADDAKVKQGKVPVTGDPASKGPSSTGHRHEIENVPRTDGHILDNISKSINLNSLREATYDLFLLIKERVSEYWPKLHKALFSEGSLKVEALLILLATMSLGTVIAFFIIGGRTNGPLVPYKGHLTSIEMGHYCVDNSCGVVEQLISGTKINESHRGIKTEWDGLPSSSTSDIERRLEQLELEAVRTARKIMEQDSKISRLEERIFHLENSIYGSKENQGVFKKLKKVENTCSLLMSSSMEKYLLSAQDDRHQVLSYKQSDKNSRCYGK